MMAFCLRTIFLCAVLLELLFANAATYQRNCCEGDNGMVGDKETFVKDKVRYMCHVGCHKGLCETAQEPIGCSNAKENLELNLNETRIVKGCWVKCMDFASILKVCPVNDKLRTTKYYTLPSQIQCEGKDGQAHGNNTIWSESGKRYKCNVGCDSLMCKSTRLVMGCDLTDGAGRIAKGKDGNTFIKPGVTVRLRGINGRCTHMCSKDAESTKLCVL